MGELQQLRNKNDPPFRRTIINCRFSYAGNWELVKSIVGTKFRRSHVCLHSQAGSSVPITSSMTASG